MRLNGSGFTVIGLFLLVLLLFAPRVEKGTEIINLRSESLGDLTSLKSYESYETTEYEYGEPYYDNELRTVRRDIKRKWRAFVFSAKFHIPADYYASNVEIVLANYLSSDGEALELQDDFIVHFLEELDFQADQAEAKLNGNEIEYTDATLSLQIEKSVPVDIYELDIVAELCKAANECIPIGGKFLFEKLETRTLYSPIFRTLGAWMSV